MDQQRIDIVRTTLMHLKNHHQNMDLGMVIDTLIKVVMILADEVTKDG